MEGLWCTFEFAVCLASNSWRNLLDINIVRVWAGVGELRGEISPRVDRAASSWRFLSLAFLGMAVVNETANWRNILKLCSEHVDRCKANFAI